jgi:hypothetical protein
LGRLIAASYLDVVGLVWNPRIPPTDRTGRALLCIIVTCQVRNLSKFLEKVMIFSVYQHRDVAIKNLEWS